jgi:hypothetical protein
VTVVTYKSKTMLNVLTEIAGLLVLFRLATLVLGIFHEQRFISKMKKETKEEFREVFTYDNFKRLQVENLEFKTEMSQLKDKQSELMEKVEEMSVFIDKIRFIAEKDKNE